MAERVSVQPGILNQRFQVGLGGAQYTLTFRWSDRVAAWNVTVVGPEGETVVEGRRVVVGVRIAIRKRPTERLAGWLLPVDTSGEDRAPGADELGDRVSVLWLGAEDDPVVQPTSQSLPSPGGELVG